MAIYNLLMLFALAVTGTLAAATTAGYQSMAPTGQWYGETFTGLARGAKQIALTYDDGPNDPHTQRLLEVLARHNVKATFFMVGRYVQQRQDIVREVANAGHAIGNHTFTHPLLTFKSDAEIRRELTSCRSALGDALGYQTNGDRANRQPMPGQSMNGAHTNLFRPPFGGRRPAVLRIARELGLVPVMWNVAGHDWNPLPAAAIEEKVVRKVRGGNVILLHDGGHVEIGADRSQTVAATDHLISRYKSDGYEFVTIPQMMIL